MRIFQRTVVALATVALTALPASAQVVTYSTNGTLTGTGCVGNTCTVGAFFLTFLNAPLTSYVSPTLVDLGQFQTQFTGAVDATGTATFGGVNFNLMINQTGPSGGSASIFGPIAGTLSYNPSGSSLIFTPNVASVTIGLVTYRLVTDQTGNIGIQAPTTNGGNPNPTSVKANVNVTPEPNTVVLMASGLFGLVPMVRRRRRA